MHGQPARCMHAKSSLTTAYAKLGCSYTDKESPIYMSAKLSKLMLNPLCTNSCQVNFALCSWHALSICLLRSLCLTALRAFDWTVQFIGLRPKCFNSNSGVKATSAIRHFSFQILKTYNVTIENLNDYEAIGCIKIKLISRTDVRLKKSGDVGAVWWSTRSA